MYTAIATALSSEKPRTTARWPRRSARRPTSGPMVTWPSARAQATTPPVARDPLVSVTSRTLPNWIMATGSLPRNEITGRSTPVCPMTSR